MILYTDQYMYRYQDKEVYQDYITPLSNNTDQYSHICISLYRLQIPSCGTLYFNQNWKCFMNI